MKSCYKSPPPGVDLSKLNGLLIVIEGPDSSGRSTQIRLLSEWLEQQGFAVSQVGLKRSNLVSAELEKAKEGNVLSPRTMSLFYATDFYDQMENNIIAALRAGFIVIADRYIFTLMVRDIVRGADPAYTKSLYSMAIVPDAVFYLKVSTPYLVNRTLEAKGHMDYWESGMDLGISRNWYTSFVKYQQRIRAEFAKLSRQYEFEIINGDRSVVGIQKDLRDQVEKLLDHNDSILGLSEG
ncbi:MAG: thymidylate kinase [Candidatus Brocadiia bacterium]